jgi:hypothetical protein
MAYNAAAVSDATIAFRKPITLQQGRALRDNPEAIAQGLSGATRIRGAAMYGSVAGSVLQRRCTPIKSASSGSNATDTEIHGQTFFTALTACTVRVTFTCVIVIASGGSASFNILRDGAGLISWTTSQTNSVYDVALSAGQSIAITTDATGNSGGSTSSVAVSKLEYSFDVRSAVMT